MKVNKIFMVSLLLLAILTLGAVSAAEKVTADELAVEDAGDVDLEVPAVDEITADGDTDEVAAGDAKNEILGTSHEEKLSNTTTITVDAPAIYNGQEATVTANVGQATGNINFTLGNDTQNIGIVDGSATYKTTDYQIGENTVTIVYDGDGTFEPVTTTATFTVLEKENATILASVYKTENKNMVVICIPGATGNVSAVINGKKENLKLINGIAIYDIDASDVISEVNVTFDGDVRFNPASSSHFAKLENNIVNNDNYMYYFNQADYGKIFEFIEPGTTLDFQGSIINSNRSNDAYMDVSTPVNIISTTGDALVCLNSTNKFVITNKLRQNSFIISNGGSWSNITGINFFHTEIWIANVSNVVLDRIIVSSEYNIGASVGILTIRDNTTYLTLKNSDFTKAQSSTTITLGGAINCTLDNNTLGSLMPYNPYSAVADNLDMRNSFNKINNNIIKQLYSAGRFNLIENNTIGTVGTTPISGGSNNTYIGNNVTSSFTVTINSTIISNYVGGNLAVSVGSIAYNNTALKTLNVNKDAEAYDNNVGGLTIGGTDALVHDNVVNGATTINAATNSQIYNNTFSGDYTIKFNNAKATDIIFSGNDVIGNIQFANKNAKNNKIINNTITTSADYAIDLKTWTNTGNNISGNILYSKKGFGNDAVNHADDSTLILDNYQNTSATINVSVNDIKVGETAIINITGNETSMATVDVFVNDKKYSLNLTKGKGTLELKDLLSGKYDVSVISTDVTYGAQNATSFNVTKNNCPAISVDAPAKTQWIDSNITVTIADATGDVILDINGNEFTSELVDGVVVFTVPDFAYGTYAFNVTYAGDYKYFGNVTNGNLTVNRNKKVEIIASDIVADKLVDKFVAKFINYIDEGIANANVTITIGDAVYPVITDENGTAIVDLALTRGKYDVNVKFIAIEDEYDAVSAEYNITVIDASIIKIVSVGEDGLVTGALYDALGASIGNAVVVASMNGTEVNLTTNDTGLFEFQAEDGCKVTFVFAGDDITSGSDASITVSIKPTPKDVSIINIVSVDGTGLITGSLTVLGNPIANAIVVASMNGTDVNLVTDDAGLFEFQAKTGLEVTFKYAGDLNTTDANASITLNNMVPVPKDTSIIKVVSVDGTGLITGSLTVLGNPIANATVVASVNGSDVNLTTDDAGLFEFQSIAGFETVFKYAGDDTTTSSDVAITLNNMVPVPKDTSIIKVVSVDGTGLITGSLTVLGNPIANATVVASVNGSDVNLTTGDAGLFEFQSIAGFETVFKYAGDDTTTDSDVSITLRNVAPVKTETSIDLKVDGNLAIEGMLKDINGNPLANTVITYVINGTEANVTTDDKGVFSIQGANNETVAITYIGDDSYLATSTSIQLNSIAPTRIATVIEADYTFTRVANDYSAGERGDFFYATLKDINGNPLANMTCYVAVNGPIYNVTTDSEGKFGVQVNLAAANTYTYALSFLGNENYEASLNCSKLILTAKKTTITASAKTFKAKATKTISVTLKTVNNAYDGKTYLKAGKKLTLKVNGKTYTAKTNAKGVAKFTIKLTKKGKYTAKISFKGDKTYKASSKSIKVTIK